MNNASSVEEAVEIFLRGFEKPENPEGVLQERINNAYAVKDRYLGSAHNYTDTNKSSGPVHLNNNKLEVDDFTHHQKKIIVNTLKRLDLVVFRSRNLCT